MSTLLVVEDDCTVRIGMEMLLEMEGYKVVGADHGRQALDLLKQAPELPCLILLDLMMPVMDGIEFREAQLKDPDLAHLPVVIITGKADLGELEHLRPMKVVRKPFTPAEILQLVRKQCPLVSRRNDLNSV